MITIEGETKNILTRTIMNSPAVMDIIKTYLDAKDLGTNFEVDIQISLHKVENTED